MRLILCGLTEASAEAAGLSLTAMAPSDCTVWAVLDDPEGPVAAAVRVELGEDQKPANFSAPFSAEDVHDLYLITDGPVKLYSWTVK